MLPHLFVTFLLVSCVVVHQQTVVSVRVCFPIEGVHRLGVVAHTGLLGYCTVKGPVLMCLEVQTTNTYTLINSLLKSFTQLMGV